MEEIKYDPIDDFCFSDREEDGKLNLYFYGYKIYASQPQRVIYPEPDKHISILSWEIQDFVDELDYLGTISMNFPKSVPEGAGKLYENEYTDVKLIHSFLSYMQTD